MKKKIIFMFLLYSIPFMLFGQEFGKNKVQYKNFDWYYIQTDHFDIYFSQGGEYLVDFTASVAEASLARMHKDFKYQIANRIPIVVYNSHNDFQQTNVIAEYMEEGVGGVTELFKNRVVVPFEGNYKQFHHVIAHELIHAYINDMFYGGSLQSIISNNISLQLPLWMNEGLAEYFSLEGWDTNSDIFIRDAVISEFLPPINRLNGYFAYRGGQSVWWYISEKYGKEKVGEILQRVRTMRSVDQGLKNAIGLSLEELSERWTKEQKILYWPDIAKREDPAAFAKRLTDHKKDNNFYNTSPSISPKGDKIAFISDRKDYFDVYVMSADGKDIDKLVDGQRTKDFEELHLLTPGIAWSPDGKKIAMAVKSGEKDAIFIIDIESGYEEKLQFDLEGIFSVNWAPVENKLTFVGNTSRQSDIYIYNLDSKKLENFTNDIFSDEDPVFSPDGKTIFFSSDRGAFLETKNLSENFRIFNHNIKQYDVYSVDLSSQKLTRITDDKLSDESSIVVAPDGKKILFTSDKNGIFNIYEKNLETNIERPITNSLNGIYQLSLSKDGSRLTFASMIYSGFDIFLMKNPFDKNLKIAELEPTEYIKRRDFKPVKPLFDSLIAGKAADSTKGPLAEGKKDTSIKTAGKDTAKIYGDNIQIDFQSYIFTEKYDRDSILASKPLNTFPLVIGKDSLGRYMINKYKLNFTPDIIYGNAGYSTFYGVEGTTQMAFSDMLGNHQIYFATNLLLDLKNSDFVLAYYYLPNRIDWGVIGYHSARFLYLGNDYYSSLYRFRNYGMSAIMSMPLTKYYRTDFNLGWMNISRENLDDPSVANESYSLLIPTVNFVHDNTLWGMTAPGNGKRYQISFSASPKLSNNGLGFYTLGWDYRKYFRLWTDYNLVARVCGGLSGGPNPGQFFIGGTENWINRSFANNEIPINSAQDFAFLSPGLPLRGFKYDEQRGTRYSIVNLELRFPLIKYFLAGPIPLFFQNVLGTAFIDAGSAWFGKEVRPFYKDENGNTQTKDLLIGMGFGARLFLLYFPVKFDIAWPYNFKEFGQSIFYVSIGADF